MVQIASWIQANWASLIIIFTMASALAGIIRKLDKVNRHMTAQEDFNTIMLNSILALLIAKRNGKANGEIAAALDELNDYMILRTANAGGVKKR